jgi:hypothetical protein
MGSFVRFCANLCFEAAGALSLRPVSLSGFRHSARASGRR